MPAKKAKKEGKEEQPKAGKRKKAQTAGTAVKEAKPAAVRRAAGKAVRTRKVREEQAEEPAEAEVQKVEPTAEELLDRKTKSLQKKISDAIKAKKLVLGTNRTVAGLKRDILAAVIYSRNCPGLLVRDLGHYASIAQVEIAMLDHSSVRLGEMCGKPFNVLMVGIRK